MDAVSDRLLAKLRQLAPHKVRVFDNSDESRDVAVPQRRKRWSQVIETIEGRPWVRCELLDKSGAVLGYVENDAGASELEDLATGGSASSTGAARERWLLELMLKAQQTALTYRDKEHAALLTSMRDMIEVNASATRELIELFKVQRDVAADVAAMQAAAENGGEMAQVIKLIEASPQLMQTFAPLIGMLMRKKQLKAPPPNGTKS